jgi:hypothetical protein
MNVTIDQFMAILESMPKADKPTAANPKTETVRLRVSAHCDNLGWNTTIAECAADLGLSAARVARCIPPPWLTRFRSTAMDGHGSGRFGGMAPRGEVLRDVIEGLTE